MAEEVIEHCMKRLALYKVSRRIAFPSQERCGEDPPAGTPGAGGEKKGLSFLKGGSAPFYLPPGGAFRIDISGEASLKGDRADVLVRMANMSEAFHRHP